VFLGGFLMNRTGDLKQKEVINMNDGKRLGFVFDIEINLEDGRIEAIILPGTGKLFGIIGKDTEIVIPWDRVKIVGEDTILVDIDERSLRKIFE